MQNDVNRCCTVLYSCMSSFYMELLPEIIYLLSYISEVCVCVTCKHKTSIHTYTYILTVIIFTSSASPSSLLCSLYFTSQSSRQKGVLHRKWMWIHKCFLSIQRHSFLYFHEQKRVLSPRWKCKKQCHSRKLWVPSAGHVSGLQEKSRDLTWHKHFLCVCVCMCERSLRVFASYFGSRRKSGQNIKWERLPLVSADAFALEKKKRRKRQTESEKTRKKKVCVQI